MTASSYPFIECSAGDCQGGVLAVCPQLISTACHGTIERPPRYIHCDCFGSRCEVIASENPIIECTAFYADIYIFYGSIRCVTSSEYKAIQSCITGNCQIGCPFYRAIQAGSKEVAIDCAAADSYMCISFDRRIRITAASIYIVERSSQDVHIGGTGHYSA